MHPVIVPIEKVRANTYNPNHVADNNLKLLIESIQSNGLCFGIVTVYDPDEDVYVIVDGFHRYRVLRDDFEVLEVPVIVLNQTMAQRMAATVQFNRARGVHQVELMGDLVKGLVDQGLEDDEIATQLGMDLEEVFRLKQITGIAALFANQSYSKSWIMEETGDAV